MRNRKRKAWLTAAGALLVTVTGGCKMVGGESQQRGSTVVEGMPSREYATCPGQRLDPAAVAAAGRAGPSMIQLAPAFVNDMEACALDERLPENALAGAGQGRVNKAGDCEFANGIVCHFHTGAEFVATDLRQQVPGRGELHCIVPGANPKSPRVFGGPIACGNREEGIPEAVGEGAHTVKEGAACSADLLKLVAATTGYRCCDEGTLTNPIAKLVEQGRNDVRPDFRIWAAEAVIDCGLLRPMTGHAANAPALGGIGAPVFGPH